MSLADLSARIYTVKSRKNIPFSTAFVTMIREDLALRYSMFNIVKSLTGSEVLAQVAESKYGFKTPLQKEEEKNEKKRMDRRKRFERFTANSLVTLNNKLNTLTALTQRNTILIENLYNDLGSFRNQRKFTKRDMNISAPKIPIRSRTVKFQIDQLKAELTALQMMTIGAKNTRALKKRAESEGGGGLLGAGAAGAGAAGAAAAGGLGGKGPGDKDPGDKDPGDKDPGDEGPGDTPTPKEDDGGGLSLGLVDGFLLGLGARSVAKRGYRFLRRKYFPTPSAGTATPVTPKPTITATKAPVLDERLKASGSQYRDPKTGRIAKRPPTPTPTATKPVGLASRAMGALGRLGVLGSRLLGAPLQAAVYGGLAMYDILTGRTFGKIIKQYEEVGARFGLKFIKGPGGTTIGYEIDGVAYTPETLPQEYKNILDAIGPDKRAAAAAQAIIASDEATYRLLETESGRKLVLPPPPTEVSDPLMRAAIAGRVALDVPEPQMISPSAIEVSAPQKFSASISAKSVTTTPVASVTTTPVAIPATDVDTVKKIIVNAAERVGVEPGIMLAMGRQESSFNPNAQPWYTDKKTGERKLLSSAKGIFQFINKTWEAMVAKYSNAYPELKNGPFDPMANALAGALYVKENSEILRRNKIPINGTTIYASHFLGPGGARVLFTSPPNSNAADVLPAPAKSNPFIFYAGNKPKTVAEVINTLYKKVGVKAEQYTAQLKVTPVQPLPSTTPGMVVASPPTMVASATPSASSMEAEISANAALAANKIVQSAVVALAGKVSDLDKLSQIDREFPAVRNASLA